MEDLNVSLGKNGLNQIKIDPNGVVKSQRHSTLGKPNDPYKDVKSRIFTDTRKKDNKSVSTCKLNKNIKTEELLANEKEN